MRATVYMGPREQSGVLFDLRPITSPGDTAPKLVPGSAFRITGHRTEGQWSLRTSGGCSAWKHLGRQPRIAVGSFPFLWAIQLCPCATWDLAATLPTG